VHHRSAHFALIALLALLLLAASLAVGVGRADALSFAPKTDFMTGAGPLSIALGDFNGDGSPDLVTVNGTTASVLLGNGSGGFTARTEFATGSGSVSVTVGDFNGDGSEDLATANQSASTTSVLLGNGSGGFAAKTDYTTGALTSSVAVGYFNADGVPDLVTANQIGTASILLGNGDGTFAAKTDFASGVNSYSVAVDDFNSDGKQDLAVAGVLTATVSVLLGNGDGTFAARTGFTTGLNPYSVAVGDFNSDGEPDLATANWDANTSSVLLGNGSGYFATKIDLATGSNPASVVVGDFNGDGKQDLATANSGANTTSVLLGDGSGGFAAKTDFAAGTDPRSIAGGDLNGDGTQDLATANRLANTASILLRKIELPAGTMIVAGGAAATSATLVRVDSAVPDAALMRFRDQGSIWSAWLPYAAWGYWALPAGDGTKTIEARYRNTLGQSAIISDSILLDTTAPTTAADAPAGWQTASPVIVTFTADDGTGSGMSGGLAKTQYKLDGAASWTNDPGVKVGDDGAHTIVYRSVDAVGNVGDIQSCTVKIDTTAPTTTVRGVTGVWQAWPQTVFLTAADASSGTSGGLAQIEYNLDGAGWVTGDWIVVSADGGHTLAVRATDAAGNVEAVQKMEVLVDGTAPTTTDNTDGLAHPVFSVVLTPSDALSGVATTSYRLDGGAWRSGTSVTLRLAIRHKRGGYSRGAHLIEYRSTDNAGNVEEIESCTVRLGG